MNNILVLSPHTDDAELGAGASIKKFLNQGKQVYIAVFSTVEDSVPAGQPKDLLETEFKKSMALLGVPQENQFIFHYPVRRLHSYRQEILDDMIKIRKLVSPDLIFAPSKNDLHQDHAVVHHEALRAFKDLSMLCYELPWNQIQFQENYFITVTENDLNEKWRALQAYKSQLDLKRPYFCFDFLKGLAKVRGVQVKEAYAEAFEVVRLKDI